MAPAYDVPSRAFGSGAARWRRERCSTPISSLGSGGLDRPGRGEAAKIQLNSLATDADKKYAFQRGWGVMSKFERLLEAGSTELPDCRCTAEMNLMAIVPRADGDTEIRIFRCPHCSHELRLTTWRNEVQPN